MSGKQEQKKSDESRLKDSLPNLHTRKFTLLNLLNRATIAVNYHFSKLITSIIL